jgi:hypothetical protein
MKRSLQMRQTTSTIGQPIEADSLRYKLVFTARVRLLGQHVPSSKSLKETPKHAETLVAIELPQPLA